MSSIQTLRDDDFYLVDGARYPRVTSIIRDCGCMPYFPKKAEQRANRGTIIHQMFRDYLMNELDFSRINSEGQDLINALQWFIDLEKLTIISCEKKIVDKQAGYAGTLDAIFERDNGDIITVDWKSGEKYYWHDAQIAAYGNLAKTTWGMTVYVDKGFDRQPILIETHYPIFKSMVDLFYWKRRAA